MKKIISLFLIFFISFIIFLPHVNAKEENIVNLYLFHSDTCRHCQEEIELLEELEEKHDNLRVYKYEISNKENSDLLGKVTNLFDVRISGVPFTVIGEKTFSGYSSENTKRTFEAVIEYYSNHGYQDQVGELIGNIELPTYPIEDNSDIDEYIEDYGNYRINIPLIGEVESKNLTLPVITVLLGLLDGFNPCAMWVLLFLISMLINMKDKKRMWILGVSFLLTSALIYLLFMVAWLNVASFMGTIPLLRLIVAIIAIAGGIINLTSYFKNPESGCHVTNDKKRNKIFSKIKKFTKESKLYLALLGVISLAISVNIIELACSAGLPVIFTSLLSLNNLNILEYSLYLILYIFCFLLDDLIIFTIAMKTLKVTGISTKYSRLTKLIGGLILLLIGILLILKPEWLMLNI